MMNILSVSVTICLIGFVSCALEKTTTSKLSVCKLDNEAKYVQLKCDVGEAVKATDSTVVEGTTLTAADKKVEYASGNAIILVLLKAKAVASPLKCKVKYGGDTEVTQASTEVTVVANDLALCHSAAPRIVNSIAVAVLCLMATFIKSSY